MLDPSPRLRNLRINNLKVGCWVLNTCSLKGHRHQLEEGREAEYPKETKKSEPNLKVPEFSGATEELFVNVLWARRRDLHTRSEGTCILCTHSEDTCTPCVYPL